MTTVIPPVVDVVLIRAVRLEEPAFDEAPEVPHPSVPGLRTTDVYAGLVIPCVTYGLLRLEWSVQVQRSIRECNRLVDCERVAVRRDAKYDLIHGHASIRPCLYSVDG